jgi:solute carrier family 25 protein 39/40
MGYETIRSHLAGDLDLASNSMQSLIFPFVSGASSGLIAAFLTTPFDVAKTLNQINDGTRHQTISKQLLFIWENEGVAGLFKGLVPRMAKVAPACALMITSYELGKAYFTASNQHS